MGGIRIKEGAVVHEHQLCLEDWDVSCCIVRIEFRVRRQERLEN